jgi:hypothetical protein
MKLEFKVEDPYEKTFTVKDKALADVALALKKRGSAGDFVVKCEWHAVTDAASLVTALTAEVASNIVLPSWPGYGGASKEDRKRWDAMVKALRTHLKAVHKAVEGPTAGLVSKLDKAPAAPKAQLPTIQKAIEAALGKAADDCQRKTGHGAKAGATL